MKYIEKKSTASPITGKIVDTFNVDDMTTNAPSMRLMIDLIYPIGRGFLDFTDTDYSNYLGCTWERELVGMTPIGKDANDTDFATVGETGGSKTHFHTQASKTGSTTLTASQSGLQAHAHETAYDGTYPFAGNKSSSTHYNYTERTPTFDVNTTTGSSSITVKKNSAKDATEGHTHTLGNTNTASSMPPYQVVSYWKRIA